MYCPKCGSLNIEEAKLCHLCSWVLRNDGLSVVRENPEAKTSGAAKAALILSIIGFVTFGITALPAFICGIIGLINIERSGGALKGKGYAIFGLTMPFITLFFGAMLLAILMPALGHTRQLAQRLICGENLRGLGIAVKIYANDYDNKIPDGSNWCSLLERKVDVDPKQFICTSSCGDDCSYAMNISVAGKDIDSVPGDMVLVFESYPGCNQVGSIELLNTDNHKDGCNILFCDGHVEFVKTEELEWLLWDMSQLEETQNAQN